MELKDKEVWDNAKANNPNPNGKGDDPTAWGDLDHDQMNAGYGACVMLYAEQWADAMERAINSGGFRDRPLADIFDDKSLHPAWAGGQYGLTGFQYGAVIATLAPTWVYGEALRRWHNQDTQIGDEGDRANESGGVLNPAIMGIG